MEHNLVLSGDTAVSSGRNEGTLTLKDFVDAQLSRYTASAVVQCTLAQAVSWAHDAILPCTET